MCHNREPQASHLCPTCFAVFGVNFVGQALSCTALATETRPSARGSSRAGPRASLAPSAFCGWNFLAPNAALRITRHRTAVMQTPANDDQACRETTKKPSRLRGRLTMLAMTWAWTSPIRQDRELLASHLCLRSFPVFGANLLEQATAVKDPPKLRGKCDTSTVPASTWPCTYARRCTTPARPAAPA